jgi:hypothetical protein
MNKTDLLFQMLEQPERYSEAQWQDILADDECRELYTLMAKTKSAMQSPQVSDEAIDTEWERLAQEQRPRAAVIPLWRKVAAAAAIVLALFGVSYAAVKTGFFGLQKATVEETTTTAPNNDSSLVTEDPTQAIEQPIDTLTVTGEPRLYDDVPLEQILSELAAYYHVDVEYRTDDVRSLRLYYKWEPDYSLDKVIEMLSHFESLSIRYDGNKLIVESTTEGK